MIGTAEAVADRNQDSDTAAPRSAKGMYRCEATSRAAFVQQLAASYLANGYYFYVSGTIPLGKDARQVDEKLIARYEIDISKYVRFRRKQRGLANLHYLRYGRFFLLLASHGEHRFFTDEGRQVRDVRRKPIRCFGYSIGVYNERVSVRIGAVTLQRLERWFMARALRRDAGSIARLFSRLYFEPYRPVRKQLWRLLKRINDARHAASLSLVPSDALRARRRTRGPTLHARALPEITRGAVEATGAAIAESA